MDFSLGQRRAPSKNPRAVACGGVVPRTSHDSPYASDTVDDFRLDARIGADAEGGIVGGGGEVDCLRGGIYVSGTAFCWRGEEGGFEFPTLSG